MQKIFELLFDQLDKFQATTPGQRPLSPQLEALGKMQPYLLKRVFDGYSVGALQAMAAARGLDAQRKRANLEQDLAKNFYEVAAIKRALEKLSPAAREGLFHARRMGGIISLEAWRTTMVSRYGPETTFQAQAELVSGLLTLYCAVHTYGIEFSFPYKNELIAVGSVGSPVYLWTHPKVLGLFKLNPTEETAFVQRELPEPFNGPEPAPASTPGFDSLLADLVSATRYFEQNKVRALVSGEPGKRDYQKLNEGLSVKEPGDIKAAKKIDELGRLYFLCTLLKETQLVSLKPQNDFFQANPAASEEFFSLPRYRQARLLLGAWSRSGFNEFKRIPSLHFYRMSYYESSLPDTHKTTQARLFLVVLLDFYRKQGALLPGEWLDFARLVRSVRDLDTNFLIDHDSSPNHFRQSFRYEYEYDPLFPVQGFYGDEYYSGFTSALKPALKNKGTIHPPDTGFGAPLKLSEDFDLVEGEWLAQVFAEPLSWLGLAELARNESGRPLAFRLTDLGLAALADQPSERERQQNALNQQLAAHGPELTKALLVQPNFDIMVMAPLENLTLLRQVDRFADQTSMGDVALYRISKDSVLRGLRNGLSGPEIIALLQENNRVPVASNVIQSIEDWAAEFERLVLYENCNLLETPDPATLDRLMAQPDAARFVIKRLGPAFALIKDEKESLKPGIVPSDRPYTTANMRGLPLYLDYRTLHPGSVSFAGPFLLKVKLNTGNPYLLFRLGQFADLETFTQDRFEATFRLTARAGQRAQQQGLTFESVVAFLEMVLPRPPRRGKSSPDPVSEETLLALKGWLGYYSPLQAEPVLTIQATQAGQLRDIFRLEEFQPALLGWAGPNIALVRESSFEELSTRLAELGMPVKPPGERSDASSIEEAVPTEKPRRGKRGVSEETTADRERKAREKSEAEERSRPDLLKGLAGPGVVGSTDINSIMSLMDLVTEHGLSQDELERLLDDLEDNPYILQNRTRRKKPWDY
jgi:hypothetical protein